MLTDGDDFFNFDFGKKYHGPVFKALVPFVFVLIKFMLNMDIRSFQLSA